MDFPRYVDRISMELPILYFKGSQVNISKLWCISVPEDCFDISKQCMPCLLAPYAAFYLVLPCLKRKNNAQHRFTCKKIFSKATSSHSQRDDYFMLKNLSEAATQE